MLTEDGEHSVHTISSGLPSLTVYSTPEEDGSSSGGIVHVINLRHVSDLELLSQPPQPQDPAPPLPEINLQRVKRRLEQNIEAKWKEVNSRGVGVSEEAQLLFDSISKM